MTQFRGLDGGIPPTIVFGQRVIEALHHPFDSGCIGIHGPFLRGPAPVQGLHTIFPENREVICVPFHSGYFDKVAPERITAYESADLLRIYEPVGGLVPADYFAFAPVLWDALDRAEFCEVVIANIMLFRGYDPYSARRGASSLRLCYRDDFDELQPDFESLVARATWNQTDKYPTDKETKKTSDKRRASRNVHTESPENRSPDYHTIVHIKLNSEFLSHPDAAAFLGVQPETLEYLRKSRRIRAVKVGNQRGFVFAISDLRDFAAKRTVPTGEEERRRRSRR